MIKLENNMPKVKSSKRNNNSNSHNNNNNNNNNLSKLIKNFFETVDQTLLNIIKKISMSDELQNDVNYLKEYCINNPTIIFTIIDYLYPYIENKDEINNKNNNNNNNNSNNQINAFQYIKILETSFDNNKILKYFINKYSSKIRTLAKDEYILNCISNLFLYLLTKLHRYHNIYDDNNNNINKDWKKLLVVEYIHRKKINI